MSSSKKLIVALFVVLFTVGNVLAVESRWRVFKDENEKDEITASMPATLNSVINSHRSFMKPKTTPTKNIGFEKTTAELQQPNEKLVVRETPVTFTQEMPPGVTFSSFSSSSFSLIKDGKKVTETTETTLKPDGAYNRLRGTTTKETTSSRVNDESIPLLVNTPFEGLDDGGLKGAFDAFRPFSTMSFFKAPPVFPQGNNGNPLRVSTSLVQKQPQMQPQQKLRIRQINAEEDGNDLKL